MNATSRVYTYVLAMCFRCNRSRNVQGGPSRWPFCLLRIPTVIISASDTASWCDQSGDGWCMHNQPFWSKRLDLPWRWRLSWTAGQPVFPFWLRMVNFVSHCARTRRRGISAAGSRMQLKCESTFFQPARDLRGLSCQIVSDWRMIAASALHRPRSVLASVGEDIHRE